MARDSMGALIPVSAQPSQGSQISAGQTSNEKFKASDATQLIGIFTVEYGDWKSGDAAAARQLELSYVEAFGQYTADRVKRCAIRTMHESETWPKIAAILKHIKDSIQGDTSHQVTRYRPPPVSPEYREWFKRDRKLTEEAFAKAKNLPDDEVCFGKRARAVVAGLED